jgi:hypothetical protein
MNENKIKIVTAITTEIDAKLLAYKVIADKGELTTFSITNLIALFNAKEYFDNELKELTEEDK